MIEKLFTSKNRVKLLECFFFRNKKGRLRQISSTLKMPVSAVSREVKNLIDLGIIKKEKDALILNKDCSYIADLRNILLKAGSFKFNLKKIFDSRQIKFAFVFGSFANNSYNTDSDIDLFVVGKISSFELNKRLRPVEKKIDRDINAVIWPLKDLKNKFNSSFIKEINKKNILMLKGDENKLREIIRTK